MSRTRATAQQVADAFVSEVLARMGERRRTADSVSDEEMFRGLDAKTVAYLRDRIAETPEVKTPLRLAARYRTEHPAPAPRSKRRFLYLMQMGVEGPVKIGSSVDVEARRKTLSTGAPYPLRVVHALPGLGAREHEMHMHFRRFRLSGEWFKPASEIFDWFHAEVTR